MLYKTRGIVFRLTRFGETSIIVNIFTEQFGLQSYLVNGVRSNSKKSKIALYQPLTLLDLVVYHKENANILRIKEVKCYYPYLHLSQDVKKSAIAMFINEIINKCVKEQSHPADLHEYISQSLMLLDVDPQPENFHLHFLVGLSRHLGFGPHQTEEILSGHWMETADELLLKQLLTIPAASPLKISYEQRQNLLGTILRFYARHIDNFGEVKSLPVLREILQ